MKGSLEARTRKESSKSLGTDRGCEDSAVRRRGPRKCALFPGLQDELNREENDLNRESCSTVMKTQVVVQSLHHIRLSASLCGLQHARLLCLPEPAPTPVHRVGDAIPPPYPVAHFSSCPQSLQSSPVSVSFPLNQLLHLLAKVLELQITVFQITLSGPKIHDFQTRTVVAERSQ